MKGTYILILKIDKEKTLRIGKLGEIEFKRGLYVYVGSGMNSLIGRVARHFKRFKRTKWHIDYLSIEADEMVVFLIPNEKIECKLARDFEKRFKPIEGFGCSDCNCSSHLFYISF